MKACGAVVIADGEIECLETRAVPHAALQLLELRLLRFERDDLRFRYDAHDHLCKLAGVRAHVDYGFDVERSNKGVRSQLVSWLIPDQINSDEIERALYYAL